MPGFQFGLGFGPTANMGGGGPAPLWLNVATRTKIPWIFTGASLNSMNNGSFHFFPYAVDGFKLVFPNWYVNSGASGGNGQEADPGAAMTIEAEVVIGGVTTRALFGGNLQGSIANGQEIVSDMLPAVPAGTFVKVNSYSFCSVGFVYGNQMPTYTAGGDGFEYGTNIASKVGSGGPVAGSGANAGYRPCAIIAYTKGSCPGIHGDSKAWGQGDAADASGDLGQIARSISPTMPYLDLTTPGDGVNLFLASHTRRARLFQYARGWISQYGINDAGGSRTGAQIAADQQSLAALHPGEPFYVTTLSPATTGTFTTTGGQTPRTVGNGGSPYEPNASNYNALVRAGIAGITGFFDVASLEETSQGATRVWKAPPQITGDGIHENNAGYVAVKNSGIITTTPFVRH